MFGYPCLEQKLFIRFICNFSRKIGIQIKDRSAYAQNGYNMSDIYKVADASETGGKENTGET